ncbi:MAG: L,D-transpeptidase family protein [Longibaculum sp.]
MDIKDEQTPKEPIKKTKRRIHLKKEYRQRLIIGFGVFIIAVYVIGCFYYHNKFMPNTSINHIQVSHLTKQEASDKIAQKIDGHNLTLTFIDQQKESINQKDSGMTFNKDNDIQKELKKQNYFLWFTHWFSKNEITIHNLFQIDENQFNETISSLQHLENQVAPVDAKVEYKDEQFTITPEITGTTIQQEKLKEAIIDAFNLGKTQLNVEDAKVYQKPQITSQDKGLNQLLKAANQYCNASITYKTTKDDVTLDGKTLMTWLSIDESGNYYKDDEEFQKQATQFVKDLSQKINIIGKAKTFTGANGRRLTVSGGNYGYKLNQEKEVEGLLKDIADGKKGIRTPVTTGIQASYENGGLGNTFVEIDMTKQHFWMHKNGKIVLESDIVTGLPSDPNRKTPAGTYYIYFMQRNRVLRGQIQADGKPEYETPVAYWMAFNRGIGLHDATWQSKFGGNVYYSRGSHGCINLPLNIAAALYDMVKVNTPVVCYY